MRDLDWDRALKTAPKADLSDAVQAAAASGQIPYEKGNFVPSYKRGGVVRKTGLARVHKGEVIVSARAAAKVLGGAKKKARKTKRRTKASRR